MRVVSTLLIATLLLCCVDAQTFLEGILKVSEMEPWQRMLGLKTFAYQWIFHQSDKNNINVGGFPDVCPKHCHCYKYQERRSYHAKVKCFKRGLNQLPDWKIIPKIIDFSNNSMKRIPERKFSKFNKLPMLLLNNNQIKNVREHTFDGLNNLEHLDLSFNNIKEIDPKIFNPIRNITELSLNHNSIRKIEDFTFNDLKKLRSLSIDYNEIKEIGRQTFNLLGNLEHLFLEHNQIKLIEKYSFTGLNKLKLLSLNNNEIEKIEPFTSNELDDLGILALHNNKIRRLEEHSFDGLKRLKYLYLMDNKMNYIHKRAFKYLFYLEGLFLSNNEINFISPTTFHSLRSLVFLHLTNNSITTISYRWFFGFYRLHDLWLDENPVVCDCSFYLNAFIYQNQKIRTKDLRDWHCLNNGTFPSKEFLEECRVPPQIGIEPRNSEAFVGGNIRLNCEAIGRPTPNITWSFNGEPLQLDDRKQISPFGSLRIKNISIEDGGEYQCNATNTEGTVLSRQVTLSTKEEAIEESVDA